MGSVIPRGVKCPNDRSIFSNVAFVFTGLGNTGKAKVIPDTQGYEHTCMKLDGLVIQSYCVLARGFCEFHTDEICQQRVVKSLEVSSRDLQRKDIRSVRCYAL